MKLLRYIMAPDTMLKRVLKHKHMILLIAILFLWGLTNYIWVSEDILIPRADSTIHLTAIFVSLLYSI